MWSMLLNVPKVVLASVTILMAANKIRVCTCRSFETQLSRVEAELLRREAPPSYGQLIAQGLIPPVEDFPVCSGNQVFNVKNVTFCLLNIQLKNMKFEFILI